jgi:RHS repeat-associated protein
VAGSQESDRRLDYLPFGEEVFAPTGSMPAQQFTGQARDGEAGQDYFHARQYVVRAGRFNAVDPVYSGLSRPQLWNRYAYVSGNPVRSIDPSGLVEECFEVPPKPTPDPQAGSYRFKVVVSARCWDVGTPSHPDLPPVRRPPPVDIPQPIPPVPPGAVPPEVPDTDPNIPQPEKPPPPPSSGARGPCQAKAFAACIGILSISVIGPTEVAISLSCGSLARSGRPL